MTAASFVEALASIRVGGTFNKYSEGPRAPVLRLRLATYLEARSRAGILLVGEAPGYRGARVSGIPFTSEQQVTGIGAAEATATIVHRALTELDLAHEVLLWNVVPTHPGSATSNRQPTTFEVGAGLRFAEILPVGRVAERALGIAGIRHPSHGGARAFRAGLLEFVRS